MKHLLIFLLLATVTFACMAPPSQGSIGQNTSSAEQEARRLTTQMKNALILNETQEEKILVINVVNLSLLKKLRETNQAQEISKTQEKYKSEIRNVLNTDQYAKFLTEFGNI